MSAYKVLCPVCVSEGERSTVTHRASAVTGLLCPDYYDQEGNHHDHDTNGLGFYYRCSRGHEWTPAYNPCSSCDEVARPERIHQVRS